MKDKHLVDRYSQYLNKCMFLTSDPFLRKKYNQYINKKNVGEKKETFYDRMEKDRIRRDEVVKSSEGGRLSKMSQSRQGGEDGTSSVSPQNINKNNHKSPKRY